MLTPKKRNLIELLAPHPPRANFHVIGVDEHCTVHVARMVGRSPCHFHSHGDEGWFVFERKLRIETEAGAVELGRGDFTVVPRGMQHSPEALVPGTTVVIFSRRDLGWVLDDPKADIGTYREEDLSR